MIKVKEMKKRIPIIFLFLTTIIALCRIDSVTASMKGALSVCVGAIIPSIFPFLLFTELLLSSRFGKRLFEALGKPFSFLFRLPRAAGAAYLIGILFGFPLGVRALAEYYSVGMISKKDAERALLISNNTGPAFLVGGVGVGLLGSARLGAALYLLEIAVTLFLGILFGVFAKKEKDDFLVTSGESNSSLPDIMRHAVLQMLSICGYVAFFSVLAALLSPVFPHSILRAMLYSTLEIGSAAAFITTTFKDVQLVFSTLAFAVCFSGLSVYLQSLDCLRKTGISSRYYLPVKVLSGTLAFFLAFFLAPCA